MNRLVLTPRVVQVAALNPIRKTLSTAVWQHALNVPEDKQAQSKEGQVDVKKALEKPTWSVSSLLPPKDQKNTPKVSSKQLHHLLRLSALPPPKTDEEESKLLSTLSSHLHFVQEIQKVDTSGVEPLRSLRDETIAGQKDAELGLDALSEALEQEEIRGKHHKRIRRRKDFVENEKLDWDPLAAAGKKVGRYFVIEGGKEGT
ncbi:Hypothetical protein R9X50_00688400 [Acrodontium crateriforme]|uniref:Glutamyl-tRNA amidotransferase complex subunit Gta3 domain-containing protein n=1 Tax=Acrodontium crateriforme TaxID=150365 RepID=A0AAQ3M9Z3_9PEZI|nr:Hypothetical protein R9X50_00688400 [Acrodontium crateriforme]